MTKRGEDFGTWCWSFTQRGVLKANGRAPPASTPLSAQIASQMKARGFRFVGPAIVYAWMQAAGLVNDHSAGCPRRSKLAHVEL
jgi:DNA-3-methyladenine glycosylase I